jgi:hypothetical protein
MNTRSLVVAAVVSFSFASAPAVLAQAATSTAVPVAGTVFGLPESVYFSGTAHIAVRPAADTVPGAPPRLVVSLDLGDVTGRGLSTGATYVVNGQANLTRRFARVDTVQLTFPFFVQGSEPTARARTAVATFTLSYDAATGALTAAKAFLAAPAAAQ